MNQIKGYVHSYETGGAVDGPGVRFVLFLNGCQMRCLYCHNPDTWKLKEGKHQTVEQTVNDIGKYAKFLQRSGGLTISGGEPLLQADFVNAVAIQIKEKYGLHIALDTNGAMAYTVDDSWFDPIDLVLLDIKQINPEKHLKLTSVQLQPVLDTAKRLSVMKKKVWLRYVLVPEWSDDYDDVEKMADFAASLGNIERVEVLPFHNMAAYKWEMMSGSKYILANTPAPTIELETKVREQFEKRGLLTV